MDGWDPESSVHTTLKKWDRSSPSLIPDVRSSWPWGGPFQPEVCVDDGRFPVLEPSIPSRSGWFGAWRSITSCHPHQQRAVIRPRQGMFQLGPRAGQP